MTGMIIRNDEGHCGPEVYEPFSGSITDLEIELRRHDTGSCLCCLPRFRGEYRGRRVSGEINVDVEGDFHVYELATE